MRTNTNKASAAKRGRNPKFPYVPVITFDQLAGRDSARSEQIRGRAFATREEAVAYAQKALDLRAADLAKKLADPRYRALREQHGLPREI